MNLESAVNEVKDIYVPLTNLEDEEEDVGLLMEDED
jgi:hypothetical protein